MLLSVDIMRLCWWYKFSWFHYGVWKDHLAGPESFLRSCGLCKLYDSSPLRMETQCIGFSHRLLSLSILRRWYHFIHPYSMCVCFSFLCCKGICFTGHLYIQGYELETACLCRHITANQTWAETLHPSCRSKSH